MGRSRYKIYDTSYPHFLTSSVVYGLPIFSEPNVARLILDSLQFLQDERGVEINAYVIMENHIHWIARSDTLIKSIQSFKSFTARKIIDYLRANQRGYWLCKLEEQKADFKSDRRY